MSQKHNLFHLAGKISISGSVRQKDETDKSNITSFTLLVTTREKVDDADDAWKFTGLQNYIIEKHLTIEDRMVTGMNIGLK